MIVKLMKYDVKKMFWVLPYIYVAAIVLSGVARIINIYKDAQFMFILGQIVSGIVYGCIGSILVNTFVQTIKVFYSNLYGDEGYLTHTLPVKKDQILIAKFLSALIVILASVAVCVVCFIILFYSKSNMEMLKISLSVVVSAFDMSIQAFVALIVFIIFAEVCWLLAMVFFAIVKANTYNSKRVSKGMLWFVIYYLSASLITLLTVVVVLAISGNLSQLTEQVMSQFAFVSILVVGAVNYTAYAVISFFVCSKLFNRGVNLD